MLIMPVNIAWDNKGGGGVIEQQVALLPCMGPPGFNSQQASHMAHRVWQDWFLSTETGVMPQSCGVWLQN